MFQTSENSESFNASSANAISDEELIITTLHQISPSPTKLIRKNGIRITSEMKLRLIYGKQIKIQNLRNNKSTNRSQNSSRRTKNRVPTTNAIRRSKQVVLTRKHTLLKPSERNYSRPMKKNYETDSIVSDDDFLEEKNEKTTLQINDCIINGNLDSNSQHFLNEDVNGFQQDTINHLSITFTGEDSTTSMTTASVISKSILDSNILSTNSNIDEKNPSNIQLNESRITLPIQPIESDRRIPSNDPKNVECRSNSTVILDNIQSDEIKTNSKKTNEKIEHLVAKFQDNKLCETFSKISFLGVPLNSSKKFKSTPNLSSNTNPSDVLVKQLKSESDENSRNSSVLNSITNKEQLQKIAKSNPDLSLIPTARNPRIILTEIDITSTNEMEFDNKEFGSKTKSSGNLLVNIDKTPLSLTFSNLRNMYSKNDLSKSSPSLLTSGKVSDRASAIFGENPRNSPETEVKFLVLHPVKKREQLGKNAKCNPDSSTIPTANIILKDIDITSTPTNEIESTNELGSKTKSCDDLLSSHLDKPRSSFPFSNPKNVYKKNYRIPMSTSSPNLTSGKLFDPRASPNIQNKRFKYQRSISMIESELWELLNSGDDEELINQVKVCLDNGLDINCRRGNLTPLLWVSSKIHVERVTLSLMSLFLKNGANASICDENGWNALHCVCCSYQHNDVSELIRLLIVVGSVNVNVTTSNGSNALHLLCCYNNSNDKSLKNAIQLLLNEGIDVNAKTDNGFTALHFTCRNYSNPETLVDILLQKQADPFITNNDKWNALHFLCRFYTGDNIVAIIQLFLKHSQQGRQLLKIKNAAGITPIELILQNPAGHFHTTFDFFLKRRIRSILKVKWKAESIMDISKLGCAPIVNWFVRYTKQHCVDAHGKSCYEILRQLTAHKNLILCKKCGTKENQIVDFQIDDNPPIKLVLPDPAQTIELLEKRIRSDLVISKERSFIFFPDFEEWRILCSKWHSDKPFEFTQLISYINKNSHSQCQRPVHSGKLTSQTCYWCQVSRDVRHFIETLLMKVANLDPRIQYSELVNYGSSADKSKLFLPDEFDYAVVLKNFSQSSSDLLEVCYNGKESIQAFLHPSSNASSSVSSGRLLSYFGMIIEMATKFIPWNLHIFHPTVTVSETCVTLIFFYRSSYRTPHKVSVDLTLAVPTRQLCAGLNSFMNSKPKWLSAINEGKGYLVPQRSSDISKWQFSTFTLERDIFLQDSCRGTVTNTLRLLKLMLALQMSNQGENAQSSKNHPSSYALKTCVLKYMADVPPPWNDSTIFNHCSAVLQRFLLNDDPKSTFLVSFFSEDIIVYYINYLSKSSVRQIVKKLNCYLEM